MSTIRAGGHALRAPHRPGAPYSQVPARRSGPRQQLRPPPADGLFGVKPGENPDTSIQTWALEEARRRLEAEGILPDPDAKKEE
ncbi:hypothetical protein SNOG_08651 [Parastagonospora nodorum SN15]|uniref:NADH dehydrogenase [ubiquinone] 1 beta subcomplex subunit 11, mitochondrial n=1 Tax=Phaeosphaeria nodorum (strain SN15 / ATCC MYA-4574 / FGSC 10173) TaxID=321614 RepID=Q0UHW3_PHANO|nr:hypothetical protein SNOG_08651 [Parastagonospora nodorum SN15]EAT83819.1 hypothetical protein SNOG_08651 [Parastagonospora nodorum SN15]